MPEVDVTTLRDLLYGPLISGTHSDITKRFHALGLSEPCTDGSATKAVRVRSTLASMSLEELRRVADAVLSGGGLGAELRNQIQDVLWDGQGPVIWERTRRKLATALSIDDLVADSARFGAMLDRWWVLGTPTRSRASSPRAIPRHWHGPSGRPVAHICFGNRSSDTCSTIPVTGRPRNYSTS